MVKLKASIQTLKLPFKEYLTLSLIGAVFTLIAVIFLQKNLPPEVPLFYGAAEGEAQLTPSWGLTIPSIISVLIILTNSALILVLKDEFIKKALSLMAVVVTFFSIVTTLKIIFLVGSF